MFIGISVLQATKWEWRSFVILHIYNVVSCSVLNSVYVGGGEMYRHSYTASKLFSAHEIRLRRQVSGFGFRINGGKEYGSQV